MRTHRLIAIPLLVPAALLFANAPQAQPRERSGEAVVKAQCSKCHEAGLHGAPKIDDRAAWVPRMKLGVDATVRSAIRGHGAMPARGGLADLTDTELRAAILYMFYPAGANLQPYAAAPAASAPNHRQVDGVDIFLGVSPAESAPAGRSRPGGKGYFYVNISLRDGASHAYIKDARVEVRAASAASGETRKLEPLTLADSVSYGNFFRMPGHEHYIISVTIRRTGWPRPIETRFDFTP